MNRQLRLFAIFFCLGYLAFVAMPSKNVDSTLKPYYDDYYSVVRPLCSTVHYLTQNKVNVKFADLSMLGHGTIGLCRARLFMYTVLIDPRAWLIMTEADRYQVMMHELSHCHMFLPHVDDPYNYMFAYEVTMSKEEVRRQLIENAHIHCVGWL